MKNKQKKNRMNCAVHVCTFCLKDRLFQSLVPCTRSISEELTRNPKRRANKVIVAIKGLEVEDLEIELEEFHIPK